jgi:hypothetical protein
LCSGYLLNTPAKTADGHPISRIDELAALAAANVVLI